VPRTTPDAGDKKLAEAGWKPAGTLATAGPGWAGGKLSGLAWPAAVAASAVLANADTSSAAAASTGTARRNVIIIVTLP
jgi:hypothetical protein